LKRRGATLLLTTHYMDEAERLCDRLVVMDKAKIVAHGSPRELIERYSTREVLELRFPDDARAAVDGRLHALGDRVETLPDRVQVYTVDGEAALQQVHALGIPLESAVVRRSTLEDVFLRITGRALVE
jgi:lipooligosaccharide transport system ATP-binding protein